MTYTLEIKNAQGNLLQRTTVEEKLHALFLYAAAASNLCKCGDPTCTHEGLSIELHETTGFGGIEKIKKIHDTKEDLF